MRGDALQTSKNIDNSTGEVLVEFVGVFWYKKQKKSTNGYCKVQNWEIILQPGKLDSVEFLNDFHRLAKDDFGFTAQAIIEQFIYAKMAPLLKKPLNQSCWAATEYSEQSCLPLTQLLKISNQRAYVKKTTCTK